MPNVTYLAIAEREPGETGWSISFPDFPEIASSASDERSIAQQAQDALLTALDAYGVDGRGLPEPTLDVTKAIGASTGSGQRIGVLVSAETPGSWVRVNISIDQSLLQRIDAGASRLGMSRSAFLAEGARRLMEA